MILSTVVAMAMLPDQGASTMAIMAPSGSGAGGFVAMFLAGLNYEARKMTLASLALVSYEFQVRPEDWDRARGLVLRHIIKSQVYLPISVIVISAFMAFTKGEPRVAIGIGPCCLESYSSWLCSSGCSALSADSSGRPSKHACVATVPRLAMF